MCGFSLALLLLILPIESAVRRIGAARDEPIRWINRSRPVFWIAMLFVTQIVYTAALVITMVMSRVRWRGIDYHIAGPWRITRLNYAPYQASTATDASGSLVHDSL